jgi:DNA-binding transcriptional ArsR family regulator
MKPQETERLKARAEVIKAMAHPTRVHILDLLADGERCVCELHRDVGSDLSTVSRHLTVLKNAGLIADRREGTSIHYRLIAPCVTRFMGCVDSMLKANLKRQAARL